MLLHFSQNSESFYLIMINFAVILMSIRHSENENVNLRCLKARLRLLCNKLSTAQQPEPRFKAVGNVTFISSEWRTDLLQNCGIQDTSCLDASLSSVKQTFHFHFHFDYEFTSIYSLKFAAHVSSFSFHILEIKIIW